MPKIPALFLILLLLSPSVSAAAIINMEFKFTPYVGDPAKSDKVETVAGKAWVYINNVPFAEQDVRADKVPVMFAEREISAAVWVPADSLGVALRKGKNTIRFEFDPADKTTGYHARLGWVSVSDQTTESSDGNRFTASNQTGQGQEDRIATGKVVFQREFIAEFATEQSWHKYPPITSLSDEDKQSLALLIKTRTEAFKPAFDGIYQLLQNNRNIQLQEMKKAACLDKAYAAGIRIVPPAIGQLSFTTTGNPEVVVGRIDGAPLYQFDEKLFERINGEDIQMCAGIALALAYPPRLVVVRKPSGAWEVVY